jgi:chloramphenicol-sensitive protein RarD
VPARVRLADVSETNPTREPYGKGILFGIGAYGLWGLLPAFFLFLAPSGAIEIVGWRILLSLVFCAILLTVTRGWGRLLTILRNRRTTLVMGAAGILIVINWLVYIFAALSGHVVEAALGYFINPIVTVLLGVFVLHEKLRVAQWVAIGISALAVILLAVNYGAFPYIALALAFSFGLYGLVKKRVGGSVDAVSGLTIETLWLSPVALAMLIGVGATSGLTLGTISAAHTTAMLATGIVTAVPLLLFAAAARRLPLTYLGLTQYLAPVLQFLLGVFLLGEDMPPARWAGFALIWLALVVLTVDMFLAGRTSRRAAALRAA